MAVGVCKHKNNKEMVAVWSGVEPGGCLWWGQQVSMHGRMAGCQEEACRGITMEVTYKPTTSELIIIALDQTKQTRRKTETVRTYEPVQGGCCWPEQLTVL